MKNLSSILALTSLMVIGAMSAPVSSRLTVTMSHITTVTTKQVSVSLPPYSPASGPSNGPTKTTSGQSVSPKILLIPTATMPVSEARTTTMTPPPTIWMPDIPDPFWRTVMSLAIGTSKTTHTPGDSYPTNYPHFGKHHCAGIPDNFKEGYPLYYAATPNWQQCRNEECSLGLKTGKCCDWSWEDPPKVPPMCDESEQPKNVGGSGEMAE